jgi:hypothetical protein
LDLKSLLPVDGRRALVDLGAIIFSTREENRMLCSMISSMCLPISLMQLAIFTLSSMDLSGRGNERKGSAAKFFRPVEVIILVFQESPIDGILNITWIVQMSRALPALFRPVQVFEKIVKEWAILGDKVIEKP